MSHLPCSGLPSKAAKHAPESKRGQHSQSINPSADERRRLAIADERVVLDLSLGCGPAVNHGRYSEPDWRYTGHGEVPVQIPLALTHAPRHSPCKHVTTLDIVFGSFSPR
jgi:hypothetical protein